MLFFSFSLIFSFLFFLSFVDNTFSYLNFIFPLPPPSFYSTKHTHTKQQLLRRINHIHKSTGLTLLQMERLLKRRLLLRANPKLISAYEQTLLQDMNSAALQQHDWNPVVDKVRDCLQQFSVMTAPNTNLKAVVACIHEIQQGIKDAMPADVTTGADELTPVTIYILSRIGTLIVPQRA